MNTYTIWYYNRDETVFWSNDTIESYTMSEALEIAEQRYPESTIASITETYDNSLEITDEELYTLLFTDINEKRFLDPANKGIGDHSHLILRESDWVDVQGFTDPIDVIPAVIDVANRLTHTITPDLSVTPIYDYDDFSEYFDIKSYHRYQRMHKSAPVHIYDFGLGEVRGTDSAVRIARVLLTELNHLRRG